MLSDHKGPTLGWYRAIVKELWKPRRAFGGGGEGKSALHPTGAGYSGFRGSAGVTLIQPTLGCVGGVCRASAQDESPITIAAIDKSALVHFEVDTRVAKRCGTKASAGTDITRPIAAYARGFDPYRFWFGHVHAAANNLARIRIQLLIGLFALLRRYW